MNTTARIEIKKWLVALVFALVGLFFFFVSYQINFPIYFPPPDLINSGRFLGILTAVVGLIACLPLTIRLLGLIVKPIQARWPAIVLCSQQTRANAWLLSHRVREEIRGDIHFLRTRVDYGVILDPIVNLLRWVAKIPSRIVRGIHNAARSINTEFFRFRKNPLTVSHMGLTEANKRKEA